MAKHLVQLVVAGVQVVGRAFAKALRQEIAASQAAAQRAGGGAAGAKHSATNQKLGMSLEEAKQILNVEELDVERIRKNYEYLFDINDKSKGGSFYIQSKMRVEGEARAFAVWSAAPKFRSWFSVPFVAPATTVHVTSPHVRYTFTTEAFNPNSIMSKENHKQLRTCLEWTKASRKFFDSKPKRFSGLSVSCIHNSSPPVRYLTTEAFNFDSIISEENRKQLKARMEQMQPSRKFYTDKPKRFAAVLVPLCHVDGQLSVLATVRAKHLKSHAGEVSFPGGMVEPTDQDHIDTALRETEEEMGIPRSMVEILGIMPPVPDRLGGTSVHGVLAYIGHVDETSFNLCDDEVESVIAVSLKTLCDPQNTRQTQFRSVKLPNGFTLPVFIGTEPRVWGLTAIILHMALMSLLPTQYKHKLKHLPQLVK